MIRRSSRPQTALADVLANLVVVYGFDNEQKAWKVYRPGAGDNTLSVIEQGKGYWLFLTTADTIDMSAWTSGSSQVHLYEGWNLVGYSGTDGASTLTSLSGVSGWDVAWGWTGGIWKVQVPGAGGADLPIPPLMTLNTVRAYWIKMGAGMSADWNQ